MADPINDPVPLEYCHVTNLQSPIDKVDMNFLNVLLDYRVGPPVATKQKSVLTLIADGVFGVYTHAEALKKRDVVKLTGFSLGALNTQKKLGA